MSKPTPPKPDPPKPVSKDVPKNAQATIEVPAIDVFTRYAFYNDGEGECLRPGEGITGVSFELDGTAIGKKTVGYGNNGKTDSGVVHQIKLSAQLGSVVPREVGWAKLPLVNIIDGDHVLKAIPPAGQVSTGPANPNLKNVAKMTWRPLFIKITLKNNQITAAVTFDPGDPTKKVNHGYVGAFDAKSIALDMKPDFVRPNIAVGNRGKPITLIVVHHTGGKIISGAMNEALNAKGPHYEIDLDGHILKFAEDEKVTSHAGESWWTEIYGCNSYAIGIEVVHREGAITEPQYTSLLRLLGDLCTMLSIPKHRIIGHADCRTQSTWKQYFDFYAEPDAQGHYPKVSGDKHLLADDRQTCPGINFEWTRLEAAGFGMVPKAGVTIGAADWGGFYGKFPSDSLKFGDNDHDHKYGGSGHPELKDVIKGLQADLLAIGYHVLPTNVYDRYTSEAVDRVRRHFFTGTRKGQVVVKDSSSHECPKIVADMIKAVLASLPAPPPPPTPATPPARAPGGSSAPAGTQTPAGTTHAEAEIQEDHGDRTDVG